MKRHGMANTAGRSGERAAASKSQLTMLRLGVLVLIATVLVVALLLPNTGLAWLRNEHPWIGEPMNWLDNHSTAAFDLVHVAAFGAVAFVLACLWPRAPLWRVALPLLALAVVSELLQTWVPGRTPLFDDVLDDAVGILAGLVFVLPLRWAFRAYWRAGKAT